ncbi:hypothetical protein H2201_002885 [Coniosporium apollinis]|uniref:Nucleolar complex-associated protein 3 n=1 Tax=Coniosporium apollinis TaxID=61459 RepID=A0ABQ9NXD7_9PEZI|nr:hypothetical protein H2201_002885 [Coniosporium apollinis]
MPRLPAAKRRRLTPPDSDPASSEEESPVTADFSRNAAQWNLEQDYENRPRKLGKKGKESSRLPIKTVEGWIAQAPEPATAKDDADSFLGSGASDEEASDSEAELEEEVEEKPKVSQRQQILDAKEELARLASLVNEDPEEHAGSLRAMAQIGASANVTVKKLALASQLAVYKDIIPGYRIRPLSEEDMKTKVSKDVRKLRSYEQSLVGGYQSYVRDLARYAKGSKAGASEDVASLAAVAISCACNLLVSVPHFNFRGEILKILVDKLSVKRVDDDFVRCRETLETLFRNDEDGNASLEAVAMLTKMIKARNYNVDESILNTFLHLRLLSELAVKGSHTSIDNPEADDDFKRGKKPKEKREFRTKKQRKLVKENKAIEKEMKEADAAVSHEERDRMQSETLKLVFATYFRVLKARRPALMGAVLEGLAKYAHLINQDFFGDILEALKDLVSSAETSHNTDEATEDDNESEISRNVTRESLLCVITAFALLQGQDASKAASTLHVDLSFFITHLYRTLYPVSLNPDIELSAKSAHLPDPHAPDSAPAPAAPSNKINIQTTTVLLLRSLSSVLLPPQALRSVPPTRIAAFTKQLLTASLHLPEKSCTAMLGLLGRVTKVHGAKIGGMWYSEERRGDGVFDPLRGEVEGSNPFAGTVWEGEILRRHFCPGVREMVRGIEKNILESR